MVMTLALGRYRMRLAWFFLRKSLTSSMSAAPSLFSSMTWSTMIGDGLGLSIERTEHQFTLQSRARAATDQFP
jgi:hypothetical protein